MERLLLAWVILSLCAWGAGKKKPFVVQVIETAAHRSEGIISLDGRVRNTGERPIQGLTLLFDFMAPGGAVISTQKFPVDEEELEVGKEAAFRAKLSDEVRAVRYRVNAVDRSERDIDVLNPGPHVIE